MTFTQASRRGGNMKRPGSGRRQQQLVKRWNEAHPVGTRVAYWLGTHEGDPTGVSKTRSAASLLGSHTAVVWIEGCSGAIALSHVEVCQ